MEEFLVAVAVKVGWVIVEAFVTRVLWQWLAERMKGRRTAEG